MAAFNVSITLGGNTRTRTGTASAGDLTRFVTALRGRYPSAPDDNAAVDLFLLDVVAFAKDITRDRERAVAVAASVDPIQQIVVT